MFLLFLLFPEVQGRHARLQQCLHPHHQCNHDQPRPTVDGAAYRHHLHVQPLLPLPPVRPSPDQRAGAAGAQHAGSAGGHPLHRGRQRPTQEGWAGEGNGMSVRNRTLSSLFHHANKWWEIESFFSCSIIHTLQSSAANFTCRVLSWLALSSPQRRRKKGGWGARGTS